MAVRILRAIYILCKNFCGNSNQNLQQYCRDFLISPWDWISGATAGLAVVIILRVVEVGLASRSGSGTVVL